MITLKLVQDKSANKLIELHPVVREAAEQLIINSYSRGVPIIITQGYRSIEYQNQLYAQGRTIKGSIVTNAKGGSSYHNYGLAIDFALLSSDGKQVNWDTKCDGDADQTSDWIEVVQEAKKLGFEWGGEFKTIVDYPHFQITFGLSITDLKSGKKPVVPEDDEMGKIAVEINGKQIADCFTKAGVSYVPLRVVSEALGAKVEWDSKMKTVRISNRHIP